MFFSVYRDTDSWEIEGPPMRTKYRQRFFFRGGGGVTKSERSSQEQNLPLKDQKFYVYTQNDTAKGSYALDELNFLSSVHLYLSYFYSF